MTVSSTGISITPPIFALMNPSPHFLTPEFMIKPPSSQPTLASTKRILSSDMLLKSKQWKPKCHKFWLILNNPLLFYQPDIIRAQMCSQLRVLSRPQRGVWATSWLSGPFLFPIHLILHLLRWKLIPPPNLKQNRNEIL